MATNATWTVVFDDKQIINQSEGIAYKILNDDAFWNQSKFSNIWAIQYGTSNLSDEVEHRDDTPHCSYAEADLGDFQQFIDRWNTEHAAQPEPPTEED